jgi:hypothetical protein
MDGFGTLKGFWGMVRGTFRKYPDAQALKLLQAAAAHGAPTGGAPALAAVESPAHSLEETRR